MSPLQKTARITGLWYLCLALCGVFGFLVVRPALHAAGDPAATLSHLIQQQGTAHLGVILELGIVAFQALAAVWFYRLFRGLDAFAAGSLAAFGLVNSVVILASAGFLATALTVAGDATLAPAGDAAATVQPVSYTHLTLPTKRIV